MPERDITLNKNKGNPASRDAFAKMLLGREATHGRILALLEHEDLSCKQIAQRLGLPMHKVSGRLSEAKEAGLVVGTKVRFEGSEIVTLTRRQRNLF